MKKSMHGFQIFWHQNKHLLISLFEITSHQIEVCFISLQDETEI